MLAGSLGISEILVVFRLFPVCFSNVLVTFFTKEFSPWDFVQKKQVTLLSRLGNVSWRKTKNIKVSMIKLEPANQKNIRIPNDQGNKQRKSFSFGFPYLFLKSSINFFYFQIEIISPTKKTFRSLSTASYEFQNPKCYFSIPTKLTIYLKDNNSKPHMYL